MGGGGRERPAREREGRRKSEGRYKGAQNAEGSKTSRDLTFVVARRTEKGTRGFVISTSGEGKIIIHLVRHMKERDDAREKTRGRTNEVRRKTDGTTCLGRKATDASLPKLRGQVFRQTP